MDLFQREMPLNEADPNNLLMHINRYLERIHAMSSLTIDDLKQAILGDPVLKAALKGDSGDFIVNYSNSLVVNGAVESGTLDRWLGGVLDAGFLLQNSIKTINTAVNDTCILVDHRSIYCCEYFVKNTGTVTNGGGILFQGLNHLKELNINNYVYPTAVNGAWSSSNFSQFTKRKLFFGGTGTALSNFKPNTSFIKTVIQKQEGTEISINALVVRKVDLGEAVPFNLPFLPSGQMVFDPTDGSVGRYDGTTIHWFTME